MWNRKISNAITAGVTCLALLFVGTATFQGRAEQVTAAAIQDSNFAYQCFSPNGVARRAPALTLPSQPSSICRSEDVIKRWAIENATPSATTTTQPATTTSQPVTTTTQPATTTTQPATTTTTQPSSVGYRDAVLADAPLAYWRFVNTSSETGAHNGSLRGSPAPLLNQPGRFASSRSIRFDGVLRDNSTTGGFLANSLARLSSSTWSNGFTLEAWAKTTTDGPE